MPNAELANQVRNAKSGKRLMFAYIHHGAEGKLLVGSRVSGAEIAEAKKEAGGGTVYQGKCIGEDGVLFFETAKAVPGTLALLVKKTITKEAGLSADVVFRQKDDVDAPDAVKKSPVLEVATGPAVVTKAKAKAPEVIELESRMKAMLRTFTVEQTGKSAKAQQLQKLLTEARALMTAERYGEAHLKLDAMDPLLTRSAYEVRCEELLRTNRPAIETALTKRGGKQIKTLYDQATAAVAQQQWPKAIKLLEETIRLVGVAAAQPLPRSIGYGQKDRRPAAGNQGQVRRSQFRPDQRGANQAQDPLG